MNGAGLAIGLAAVVLAVKYSAARASASGASGPPPPSVASWTPYLSDLVDQAGLPLAWVLRWIQVESGGNPFAVGNVNALGPDGFPREMGLSQLYNPDDLRTFGLSSAQLRAGADGNSQRAARALTDEEKRYHASAAVRHMARCRDRATTALNGALVVGWSTRDRLTLAKLVHGLPGLVKSSLLAGTTSWAQYRAKLEHTKLDAGTERYRSEFSRIFANAEKTAAVVP